MNTLELMKCEAEVLFDQHGLGQWTLEIDNRKKRAMDCCWYREKLIWISLVHCEQDSREDVLDTLLHEIAHALIPPTVEDTPHGPQWRAKARELGCSERAIENNGRTGYREQRTD